MFSLFHNGGCSSSVSCCARLTLEAQGSRYRNLPVLNFDLVVVLGLNLTPNVVWVIISSYFLPKFMPENDQNHENSESEISYMAPLN